MISINMHIQLDYFVISVNTSNMHIQLDYFVISVITSIHRERTGLVICYKSTF